MRGDTDMTSQAQDLLRQRLFVHHTDGFKAVKGPGIETVLDGLFNDMPAALGTDYQAFLSASAKRDECELGRLLVKALDRCADSYIASDNGRLRVELIEDTLRDEA